MNYLRHIFDYLPCFFNLLREVFYHMKKIFFFARGKFYIKPLHAYFLQGHVFNVRKSLKQNAEEAAFAALRMAYEESVNKNSGNSSCHIRQNPLPEEFPTEDFTCYICAGTEFISAAPTFPLFSSLPRVYCPRWWHNSCGNTQAHRTRRH